MILTLELLAVTLLHSEKVSHQTIPGLLDWKVNVCM